MRASGYRTDAQGVGGTAVLMVPKWFDKNPALSNAEDADAFAPLPGARAERNLAHITPRTAFGHFVAHYAECLA